MIEGSADAVLRNYLAGLVFRFRHVTDESSEDFAGFEAGSGVRTPAELVRHMTGLVLFAARQFEADEEAADLAGGGERPSEPQALPWPQERARFVDAVWSFHGMLAGGARLRPGRQIATLEQVWHGPLSDLMTHVGQLATLRRLAGEPVRRVRYWQVDCPGPDTAQPNDGGPND